jgi:hypothetical protein
MHGIISFMVLSLLFPFEKRKGAQGPPKRGAESQTSTNFKKRKDQKPMGC